MAACGAPSPSASSFHTSTKCLNDSDLMQANAFLTLYRSNPTPLQQPTFDQEAPRRQHTACAFSPELDHGSRQSTFHLGSFEHYLAGVPLPADFLLLKAFQKSKTYITDSLQCLLCCYFLVYFLLCNSPTHKTCSLLMQGPFCLLHEVSLRTD